MAKAKAMKVTTGKAMTVYGVPELKKALMHKLFTEGTRGEPVKPGVTA